MAPLMPGRSRFFALLSALLMGLVMMLPLGGQRSQTALAAMDVAKQVLIGADFHGADLQGATFNLTNLREGDWRAFLEPSSRKPTCAVLICGKPLWIRPS
jgi:uncharacterized protein YjbI with pentapeptide repeats